MKYRICCASGQVSLMNAVNQAIEEGWRPVGGVAIAIEKSNGVERARWAQAMVKEDGDDQT